MILLLVIVLLWMNYLVLSYRSYHRNYHVCNIHLYLVYMYMYNHYIYVYVHLYLVYMYMCNHYIQYMYMYINFVLGVYVHIWVQMRNIAKQHVVSGANMPGQSVDTVTLHHTKCIPQTRHMYMYMYVQGASTLKHVDVDSPEGALISTLVV